MLRSYSLLVVIVAGLAMDGAAVTALASSRCVHNFICRGQLVVLPWLAPSATDCYACFVEAS